MDENDGYAMMLARMKALEQIALECFIELCSPLDEATCKRRLESTIDNIAPGCGHNN
jgi:hypothetical protein